RCLEDLARSLEDRAARDTCPDLPERAVERLLAEPVPLVELVARLAEDERPCHVGVDARFVVVLEEVDDDRLVAQDLAEPGFVSDGGLRTMRDDQLVGARAKIEETAEDRRLHL